MSRKTLQAAVMAVVGDHDSESEYYSEGEQESMGEFNSDKQPDSGREPDNELERESYTDTSGGSPLAVNSTDSLTPCPSSITDRTGSSRTPLRRLQHSCPSRLPMGAASVNKPKSRSLTRHFSGDESNKEETSKHCRARESGK